MEQIGYIYKITSPSGKIYIGKTNNLRNRICAYRNAQKSNTNTLIYTSIKKYGWDAHVFKVIDSASINVLNELEISYIQKYISNQMNIEYASIKRALNKKYKTAGGYVWKYKKELQ